MTIPYRVGDVVLIKGREDEGEQIISELDFRDSYWAYGLPGSAWYDHEDFILVREADEESIEKLILQLNEDFEDENYGNEEEEEAGIAELTRQINEELK